MLTVRYDVADALCSRVRLLRIEDDHMVKVSSASDTVK